MRNRSVRALLVAFTAIGLLLGSTPANAASVSWEDEEGDATYFFVVPGTPNEKAFDITTVTLASDGTNFTYEAVVPEMTEGHPSPAYGYFFRLYFTVAGTEFYFRVGEWQGGEHFEFRGPGDTAVECKDCTGVIDREGKRVVATAPLSSLTEVLKAGEYADAAPGEEVTAPEVISQRYITATLTADIAAAPEGTAFTL
ncbi:MAG: hypothetical protein KY395_05530 [Actinobacteria bacterium]|nr:hypothetical protein [Actinomycetota bacterium]